MLEWTTEPLRPFLDIELRQGVRALGLGFGAALGRQREVLEVLFGEYLAHIFKIIRNL